ncbi:ATP-dependent DNA/RNA helicase [Podosphaera aphanis]|nr:ATP-dependent DNA/RNA helicase [Podosphaera aphanis]
MNYCTSSVRVVWPRLYCEKVFKNPNRRCLSYFSPGSIRVPLTKRRHPNLIFLKEYAQQVEENNLFSPHVVPNCNDYPLLPKAIFKEPWAIEGWESVDEIDEIHGDSRTVSSGRKTGTKKWKYSLSLRFKNGQSYSASYVAQLKKEARKHAAIKILAKLHEQGVFTDISKKVQDENEKAKLEPVVLNDIKRDAYNYGASILLAPQVTVLQDSAGRSRNPGRRKIRNKPKNFTVIIKLEERNILIETSGPRFSRVEIEAYTKFIQALKQYPAQITSNPSLEENKSGLNISNAKEFVFYYKRRSSHVKTVVGAYNNMRNFSDESGNAMNVAQVSINGEKVGAQVYSRKSKGALELAYLTAAIEIAKNDQEILQLFLNEKRGSTGEIVHRSIQVPFSISHNTLMDLSSVSRPVLIAPVNERLNFDASSLNDIRLPRHTRSGLSVDEARSRSRILKLQHEAFQLNPYFRDLRKQKASLPMNQYRAEVLKLVNDNAYSIIVGQTGSGKTTQVPAIVLEDAIAKGEGTSVNIICTQPRRIAAKSVASRVAVERGETLQQTVGYHVYLDVKRPKDGGSITYCTTEILLKQLQNDPDHVMNTVSHIVIDEAHERDIPIDFLFITLKKMIHARRAIGKSVPNVVIMSATLNIDLFTNYFGRVGPNGVKTPCPSLTVPGKTFPVKKKYLNEILSELTQTYKKGIHTETCMNTKKYLQIEDRFSSNTNLADNEQERWVEVKKDGDDALIPYGLVSTTIAHIVRSTSEGAILTFLPGLKDLEEVQKCLLKRPLDVDFSRVSQYQIILLHSLMKDNQNTLFEPSPPGCRKIILATNIAETSITISDVQHVVDTGKLNEMHYDPMTRIKNLKCTWASKSNARQRAGRAGRVQNGNYYALFSESRFESLREYGLPQMLRSDLQDVCLSTKGQVLKYPIKDFLADAVEKPPTEAVDTAIKDLIDLGALTENEDITPLGRLLHSLPLDPDLGKMIVLGVIFRCFDPLLTLAAASSERDFFVRPPLKRKESDNARKYFGNNSNSDAIALINAFRFARKSRRQSTFQEYMSDMNRNFLSAGTFDSIEKKMLQIEQVLIESGLIPRAGHRYYSSLQCGHSSLNENSNNRNLIKALTLARCPGNLAVRIGTSPKFRTKNEVGFRIKSGLNALGFSQRTFLPKSAIVSYASIFKDDSSTCFLRDTNLISPMGAILFGGPLTTHNWKVSVDEWITFFFETDSKFSTPYRAIMELRLAMNKMLSKSFLDLSKRKSLLDDPLRRDFTSSIAHLLEVSSGFAEPETEEPKEPKRERPNPGYRTLYPFVNDLLTEMKQK